MPFIKLCLLPILVLAGFGPSSKNNFSAKANSETISKQEMFSFLRCHRQAKNIVVNWGMTTVTGVHHFVIYHSEDGDFFDPIEEVFPVGALKFSHTHESVFPGYHHYYIAAVMNGGSVVNSPVDIVRIVGH